MGVFDFLFKREKNKHIKKLSEIADKIEALEEKYSAMTNDELRAQTEVLRGRYAEKETLDDLLPDAFAVVREASKRVLNMRHFKVQLIGGIVLHQGRIAEMRTGEGKTLVATLPAYLNAIAGEGVHIVTVNDYLAKRDSEWMGKIFRFLGMSVGVITHDMSLEDRKKAYAADVTYCTNNELGFDYLKDNMVQEKSQKVQRGLNYVIIDEIDSILIDEARTPLIISGATSDNSELYKTVARFVKTLTEEDYDLDIKDKQIYLNDSGVEKAERYFRIDNLGDMENADLNNKIHSALRAQVIMHRDQDYIVENGEIVIVDEFTGRKMEGRRYSEGLHQSIEAKEGVAVRNENRTVATITFQNLFRLYKKMSGMTGTAMTEEAEFKGIYSLDVVEIPTNAPMIRVDEPDKIFTSLDAKYNAIVEEVAKLHAAGQPVLVGTVDVEVSELISKRLAKTGLKHNVLNAKNNENEAAIIAQAGKVGAVTIATNMAGRGTDILLGGNPEFSVKEEMRKEGFTDDLIETASAHNALTDEEEIAARNRFETLLKEYKKGTDAEKEKVIALGGLRVIGSARHESRRIDNQLRGRSGRQGDPGSSCFYLSFEDDLLKRFGGERLKTIAETLLGGATDVVLQAPMIAKQIENAQIRCEEANYQRRRYVLNYDDVMNAQREIIYAQRDRVMEDADVHDQILGFFDDVTDAVMAGYEDFSQYEESEELIAEFNQRLRHVLFRPDREDEIVTEELCVEKTPQQIRDFIASRAKEEFEEKCRFAEEHGFDYKLAERIVLLNCVDQNWVAHIDAMDVLKRGIGLRGLGHKDPVIEYRREGSIMFDEMIDAIKNNTVQSLVRWDVERDVERRDAYRANQLRKAMGPAKSSKVTTADGKKVGRNDPCPCGSGKKYKNCCGK